jgi:HAD superfamily hydrolase (TIGR01509 family)
MSAASRPAGVVLDLDGTLVDTVGTRIEAWMRTFAEEGIDAARQLVTELIGSDGRYLARTVGEAAGKGVDDARAERIDARSGAIYSSLNTDPRPLPGAAELLAALDERSIPWAIGTSSRREQVGRSVASLQLSREPTIVDGSAVARAKPHPDLLLAAAKALEVDPTQCWCIGDSTWDMRAAGAAGMVGIGILAGSAIGRETLRQAGARDVFDTLTDLIPLLDGDG